MRRASSRMRSSKLRIALCSRSQTRTARTASRTLSSHAVLRGRTCSLAHVQRAAMTKGYGLKGIESPAHYTCLAALCIRTGHRIAQQDCMFKDCGGVYWSLHCAAEARRMDRHGRDAYMQTLMASKQLPMAPSTGCSSSASARESLWSRQARMAALDHAAMASLAATTSSQPCIGSQSQSVTRSCHRPAP